MTLHPSRSSKPEIVVFSVLRESTCSECGKDIHRGSLLRMEEDRPLCRGCADLGHLVFLPRGDTALTRRACKHSTLKAVVVRFSRSRKRYERQGVLVEEEALARAEEECLEDEDARARARARAAERRSAEQKAFVKDFAAGIAMRYPKAPAAERRQIAEHACVVGSGRVGRSAAAKDLDPEAIDLAVRAYVRHRHTPYDGLLARGLDRSEARRSVEDAIAKVLARWR